MTMTTITLVLDVRRRHLIGVGDDGSSPIVLSVRRTAQKEDGDGGVGAAVLNLTAHDLHAAAGVGGVIRQAATSPGGDGDVGLWMRVDSASPVKETTATHRNQVKLTLPSLLSLVVPVVLLISAVLSYVATQEGGMEAVFPSPSTSPLVAKMAVWLTLIVIALHEHYWYWVHGNTVEEESEEGMTRLEVALGGWVSLPRVKGGMIAEVPTGSSGGIDVPPLSPSDAVLGVSKEGSPRATVSNRAAQRREFKREMVTTSRSLRSIGQETTVSEYQREILTRSSQGFEIVRPCLEEEEDKGGAVETEDESSRKGQSKSNIPPRFVRAAKGDPNLAAKRYQDTLAWRAKHGMDTILSEPHPHFSLIKQHYPHFHHLRGRDNQPCYYESPPKMNLKALREAGLTIDDLLTHYAMVCEFTWTFIEPDDEAKSIYVIDLAGIKMFDFAGEVIDFTRKASAFTADHYPERLGTLFVINVPSWFSIIWNAVKGFCDDVTQRKIVIMRAGDNKAILRALEEKIDPINIPPEYGGKSMPLGQSPEEKMFIDLMAKNNGTSSDGNGIDKP